MGIKDNHSPCSVSNMSGSATDTNTDTRTVMTSSTTNIFSHLSSSSSISNDQHYLYSCKCSSESGIVNESDNENDYNTNDDTMNIGKIRRFNKAQNKFTNWEPLFIHCGTTNTSTKNNISDIDNTNNNDDVNNNTGIIINLNRGGQIAYYPKIIAEEERKIVTTFMDKCELFRQYRIRGFKEPRVHVLLSSSSSSNNDSNTDSNISTIADRNTNSNSNDYGNGNDSSISNSNNEGGKDDKDTNAGLGYASHGVKMKALPLCNAPPDYCIVDDCFQGEEYFMFFFFAWTNCQVQSISDVINKEEAKNEKDSSLCERKSKLDDTKDNGDNFEFETALTLYDLNKDSVSNLTNPDMVRELSEGFGVQLEQTAS